MNLKYAMRATWAVLAVAGLVLTTGCPRPAETKATILLTAGGAEKQAGQENEVALEDIQSLTVTVTGVILDYAGTEPPQENAEENQEDNGDEHPNQEQNEEQNGDAEQIEVFSGAVDVDLADLAGLSEALAAADLPAGWYTKVRLEIANPRLVLVADPETVITNIQLTANSRLFINKRFQLAGGPGSLVLLDLGGLHLVETGNGKYVFTPQLDVDLSAAAVQGRVTGVIESVDGAQLTVALAEGTALVDASGAAIYLPGEAEPTGTLADLVPGAAIMAKGLLDNTGAMTATEVRLMP